MKRLLITFLMIFTLFAVACGSDGGSRITGNTGDTDNIEDTGDSDNIDDTDEEEPDTDTSEFPDEDVAPEGCTTEGEIRDVSCGYNGNGTMQQICTDGEWVKNSECDDPDVCENDDTQSVSCGYNANGTQPQVCVAGQWENDGECDDPDECENDTYRTAEGTVEICVSGQWQYLRETAQWGTSEYDRGRSVAVDSSDNIYVTGQTYGDLDGNTHEGGWDIFLTKYSSDGTKQWTKQWGTSEWDYGWSVAVDSSDNIYVVGSTSGDLDGNTNAGFVNDIFLTKYSSDGTKQWTKQWGTSENDYGNSVAVDSSDNIYVTGYTEGDLDGNTYAGGYGDIFLTKYSSDGTKQWTQQWGTSKGDRGSSVAVDSSDNIYVTGDTYGDLDGTTNAGSWDIFLTKYSSDGTKQWTQQWGTSEDDTGKSVAVDSSDNIYVTGYTEGDLDGNTYAGGYGDIFLTKYSSDGTKQWTQQWGTSKGDRGSSVAVDSSNNIYVTGFTGGDLDGNTSVGGGNIFLTKNNSDGTKQWTTQWGTSESDSGISVAVDSSDNIYVTGYTFGDLDGNTTAGESDIFLTKWFADMLD